MRFEVPAVRFDPEEHHRRSIRLRGYDYADAGLYYVTIVTQNRESLLGNIVDHEMCQNVAGLVVECWWQDVMRRFPSVMLDAFIVMPNHIHGLIVLGGNAESDNQGYHAGFKVDRVKSEGDHVGSPLPPTSLARVIGWFKTMTTNDYIRGVKQDGWPAFDGRLWQRNYYERIISSDRELDHIREYIANNPQRWHDDNENPDRI